MNRKAFHRLFLTVVLLFAVVLSCLSCSDQSQKNFGEASGEVYRGAGELQTSAQIDVRDAEDAKTDFQSGFTLTDDAGSEILRTDLTGSVVVYKQGEDIKYKTNFNFFGTTYFKWWYFVVTFVLINILTTFCFNKKTFKNS